MLILQDCVNKQRHIIYIGIIGMALVTMMTACRKNYFNKEDYDIIVEQTWHNDTVDARHTWNLLRDGRITVKANVKDVKRIDLLTANPYVSEKAEVLNTADAAEGDEKVILYSVPTIYDSIYVDAVTTQGAHYVKAVPVGASSADFTTLNTKNSGTWSEPNKQEIYYCYCNSFPKPSYTWDFNDCVFRISKEVVDDYTLRLNVTLEAMGTLTKTAAAIRLQNVGFDQVESVTISNNRTFVRNTEVERTYITGSDLLLKGKDGSAVINLFDDGHLAFYSRVDQTGQLYRYFYNVNHTINSTYAQFTAPTVSFDIKFKQNDLARDMTWTTIDPFIVCVYNVALVEIHKFRYKLNEVLFDFIENPQDYRNSFTWALEIPYSWFRWPLEGNAIGSYKNGALYGTYSKPYHSFGEWGADRTQAQDWYLYPETNMVY